MRDPPAFATAGPPAATDPRASCRRSRCCRWHRLDVAPFLVLYAMWGVWALKLLITQGWEQYTMVQLGTYSLLALHVSKGPGGPAVACCLPAGCHCAVASAVPLMWPHPSVCLLLHAYRPKLTKQFAWQANIDQSNHPPTPPRTTPLHSSHRRWPT